MMQNSIKKEIKSYLESVNVCQRCILRFLSYKEYTGYATKSSISEVFHNLLNVHNENSENGMKNNSEALQTAENELVPSPKRISPSPCTACLGILQDSCEEMLSKVQLSISESGHEFEDFVLQLSFPVVLDLRDQLFLIQLKENFSNSYTVSEPEIPSVKEVWKWIVGSALGKATNGDFKPYSDFQISVTVIYPDLAKECLPLFEKCPEAFPNRKKKKALSEAIYNRTSVMKAMEFVSSEIKNIFTFPPPIPDASCICKIQCQHSPIYLGGRYNKYSRELPQTPWLVDGERRMDTSVNELITDVVQKWIMCDKITFSSSGREDVDVQMLGNGRPFILEIFNPRKMKWSREDMKQIENEINGSTKLISIRNFQLISKKDTLLLKEGEELKRKWYSALCIVKKTLTIDDITKLDNVKDLMLLQKTPLRVLHRRTLATRERLLHSIQAKMISSNILRMKVETQAGTYVKEFVHGDFGRTVPNLGTLLNTNADILELDVESIELDWPPEPS